MKRNILGKAAFAAPYLVAIIFLYACGFAQGGGTGTAAPPTTTGPPSANDYYVATTGNDSGDGSAGKPWRTIGHAATIVGAGGTVHVLPGVYNESVFLDNGGTPSARVRFVSDTAWAAKITGDGSGKPAIQIRNADYVDIIGFEITNVNGYIGIESLASYSRIIANLVHGVSGGCMLGQFTLGGAGINLAVPGHDVDVIGNVIHDVGDYLNPHGCESTHGIYVENADSPNMNGYSTRAWNNIIYRNESDGITSWHCATRMVIVNNDSFENGKTGILVGANDPGCVNDYSVINNNILVHNGWHDSCTYADASQCPIGSHSGKGGIYETGNTGPHNQYWSNLSFENQYNGAGDDTIHLSTGMQQNSIAGIDPLFVNYQADGTGNYHLQATSPAIDKGTGMDAPPYDFDNYPRPYGAAYDIGAYEWHP